MSEKNTNVWTIAEAANGKLKSVSYELLARGRSLADACDEQLVSVLMGANVSEAELTTLIQHGADLVISVQDPDLMAFIVETYSNVLIDLVQQMKPNIILAGATNNGRTLMPHVAMRLHTGLTADCTDLQIDLNTGDLLQTRPAIGGNILATIKTPNHRPQMATVRPRSTQPLPADPSRAGHIQQISLKPELVDKRVKLLSFEAEAADESNLQDSDVIVSGGRGMKKSRQLPTPARSGKLIGRQGWRLARRGRPRLGEIPAAGRPERQNGAAKALYRFGHLRRHSAPGGHENCRNHCGCQHGPQRGYLPGGGFWDCRGCLPGLA